MSIYQFVPSPNFGISEHEFVTWDNGFTEEELNLITEISNKRKLEESTVDGNEVSNSDIRISDVSWIEYNNDSSWLYDRLAHISNHLNGQFYRFDLFGFKEDFQYTVYHGERNGHYDWHLDSGVGTSTLSPRKLSIVVQLSDPNEYEGGDLEIMIGKYTTKVEKKKGLVAVFPSFRLHRVTPVTKGIRKSLVAWITGPSFR